MVWFLDAWFQVEYQTTVTIRIPDKFGFENGLKQSGSWMVCFFNLKMGPF
jgi:hypothetical protein